MGMLFQLTCLVGRMRASNRRKTSRKTCAPGLAVAPRYDCGWWQTQGRPRVTGAVCDEPVWLWICLFSHFIHAQHGSAWLGKTENPVRNIP